MNCNDGPVLFRIAGFFVLDFGSAFFFSRQNCDGEGIILERISGRDWWISYPNIIYIYFRSSIYIYFGSHNAILSFYCLTKHLNY